MNIINQVVAEVEKVEGVKLLDVDPGATTNRTVITFVGEPHNVCQAAFNLVKKAQELIDMRNHHGDHPRFGATDVCPLIPVANISMEEVVRYARELGEKIGKELEIPVYCYESAAFEPKRKNLASCRQGEYEGLSARICTEEWKPCFGPCSWSEKVARSGATAVGARDFLLAVNYNLNTTSTRRANAIAFDVREKGRPKREGGKPNGKPMKDENGKTIMIPGTLKGTKAIGWYIEEYGIAQVSMNITDINATPLHKAFDEVCRAAQARGLRVTGTEIVGLIPKRSLTDAGKYFLEKQHRSTGISEEEIIRIAVKSMGLDDLRPFNPREKVIEYMMEDDKDLAVREKLIRMTCRDFAEETASESPAPGGGSVSAYMGALGAALGTMVANLSAHKPGWDDRWKEFSDLAGQGQAVLGELLALVDEDTAAFNGIMAAYGLPKGTPEEAEERKAAIEKATRYAAEVPLKTMRTAVKAFPLLKYMALEGNPNSVSDAGVGALAARSAVLGAGLNVRINAAGLSDKAEAGRLTDEAAALAAEAAELEKEILDIVDGKIK